MDTKSLATSAMATPFDFTKSAEFRRAIPVHIAAWAAHILAAAQKYAVSPWFIAGVIQRESLGGKTLVPPGPAGTGDFFPRRQGSRFFKFADPKTGLPPDKLGWGRGLMQIDYGVHNTWVTSQDWRDPLTNINYGTSLLAANLKELAEPSSGRIPVAEWRWSVGMPSYRIRPWRERYPFLAAAPFVQDPRPLRGEQLYEAAIAAYNAGTSGVLQALGSGLPAEAATTGQDYVTDFLRILDGWISSFNTLVRP